jgi:hypothetical protein
MTRYIDLSRIPTPQLKAIRSVLANGGLAVADSREVKKLRRENARLKLLNERSQILAGIDVDINEDQDFWLGLTDYQFDGMIERMKRIDKETALAEKTASIKVPRLIGVRELNALDTIREGFSERRNNGNGGGYYGCN